MRFFSIIFSNLCKLLIYAYLQKCNERKKIATKIETMEIFRYFSKSSTALFASHALVKSRST